MAVLLAAGPLAVVPPAAASADLTSADPDYTITLHPAQPGAATTPGSTTATAPICR